METSLSSSWLRRNPGDIYTFRFSCEHTPYEESCFECSLEYDLNKQLFIMRTDAIHFEGTWTEIMSKIFETGALRLIECYLEGGYLKDIREDMDQD